MVINTNYEKTNFNETIYCVQKRLVITLAVHLFYQYV